MWAKEREGEPCQLPRRQSCARPCGLGLGGARCTGETLPGSGWDLKMEPGGFAEGLDGECRERRAEEDFMVCGSYTSEGDTVL